MREIPRPAILDGSFHQHLLRDRARLDAYAEAIAQVVRAGDVVADIGSGSGILAFLAAKAGARKVHAVESNTNSYSTLLRLVRLNGMTGRVVPTLADGTEWTPPEDVDVVICELMETGLLHESIAAVMRNVHSWKHRPPTVVPRRVELLVEGVELDDVFHGYRASTPGFRGTGAGEALTQRHAYAAFDLQAAPPGEGVDARFELTATRAGALGALQLRTLSVLAEGVELLEGPAYCTPLVLTLDEPLVVRAGDRLACALRYDFDYTSEPIRFDVQRA